MDLMLKGKTVIVVAGSSARLAQGCTDCPVDAAIGGIIDTVDIDVVPDSGSIVFLSELEHEVLPATRERFSIAAWMRRRA